MASFPEYRPRTLVETIGVIRPADRGQGFFEISRAAGQAAAFIGGLKHDQEIAAVANAAEAGRNKDVTLDAGGMPQVTLVPNDSAAHRAERAAALTGYLASVDTYARQKAVDIRAQFPLDPEGFRSSWKGQTEGALQGVLPEIRGQVAATYAKIGGQHYDSMTLAKVSADRDTAHRGWTAQLNETLDHARALAWEGQAASDEYSNTLGLVHGLLQRGVDSQFLSPAEMAVRARAVADEGEALSFGRHAVEEYDKAPGPEGIAAARALVEARVNDPALAVAPERRLQIDAMVERGLSRAEGLRRDRLDRVRADADAAMSRLLDNRDVSPGIFESLARQLRALGDAKAADRLDRLGRLQIEVGAAAGLPLAEIAQRSQAAEEVAAPGDASAFASDRADAYGALLARKRKNMTEDAFSAGARYHADIVGKIDPIDWSKPDRAVAVLRTRARQASQIASIEHMPVAPVTADETHALERYVGAAPADDVTRIMDTLARGLGRSGALAVAGKIVEKQPEFALALANVKDRPQLAREIVLGGHVLRENPDVRPGKADRVSAIGSVFGTGAASAFTEDTAAALGPIVDAASALYAGRRAGSGDQSYDSTAFETALRAVVGGVFSYHGRNIIAPVPGMAEDAFAAMMDRLSASDLIAYGNGAPVFQSGKPVTIEDFNGGTFTRGAELVSGGPGRYLVYLRGVGYALSDRGGAYVLDLGRLARGAQ